jgi:hypothetical protein
VGRKIEAASRGKKIIKTSIKHMEKKKFVLRQW